MTEEMESPIDMDVLGPIKETPIAPAVGIAALAMGFAMKYADLCMVKDGVLYQQFKLEGRNTRDLNWDWILEDAKRIEAHLVQADSRLKLALLIDVAEDMGLDLNAPEEDAPE